MALDHFSVEGFPDPAVTGQLGLFRVTALDAGGAVDTTYVGTATFTSDDPSAVLPAPYTFLIGDAGIKQFFARLNSVGDYYLTATDIPAVKMGQQRVTILLDPAGWGLDPYGIGPYGSGSIGLSSLKNALAISTREVQVGVNGLVQDNSPFFDGDALNPATWTIQRLDTFDFLHVVQVTQVSPTVYTLMTLEEFGPASVEHRVSSTTLLDAAGFLLGAPRQADFLGILDEDKDSISSALAKRRVASRDFANPQTANLDSIGGTLILDGAGDYDTVTGADLVRKLITRRLMTTPGDFFHLPNYGLGLRMKEPLPTGDLVKLKQQIEQQVSQEPEVEAVQASLSLASNGVLTVTVKARLKKTGQAVSVGLPIQTGVVL